MWCLLSHAIHINTTVHAILMTQIEDFHNFTFEDCSDGITSDISELNMVKLLHSTGYNGWILIMKCI